jgi:glycosyltransferase involved in cell wall biosynthesis
MALNQIDRSLAIISHKYHVGAHNGFEVKGGFQTLTDEIALHFRTVNLCVPVANEKSGTGRSYRDNLEITPLPPFRGRKGLIANLPEIWSVMWRVAREADIVYCMGPNDVGILAMVVARLQGKKMFASLDTDRAGNVLRMHYSPPEKYAKYVANRFILYPLIRFLCKDIPVFVTGDMFLGEYPSWTQWVKTTMRRSEMPPKSMPVGKSQEAFHVVFAGRLSPVKNLRRLIHAIHMISTSGVSIRCTIIGSGQLRNDLERLANRLDVTVKFTGEITNEKLISSRFLDADVLTLPSLEERQGKVILEAMACSVPVVASHAGGIPTVIDDSINGLLCNPQSVKDIARKIKRVAYDLELRKKLVDNGYEYAQRHALDVEVKRLMDQVTNHYDLKMTVSESRAATARR